MGTCSLRTISAYTAAKVERGTTMTEYKNLLVPIDLNECSRSVLNAAVDIARRYQGQLTILHVVEYVPVNAAGDAMLPTAVDITDELAEQARTQLDQLSVPDDVHVAERRVIVGRIKTEIIDAARAGGSDLIVIGSHERHGLALLLNYTEDTVLHQAPCDVLAVRLRHD